MITVFSLLFDVEYIAFIIADCSALQIEFFGSCLLFIVLSGNTTAYSTFSYFFDSSVYALTSSLYFSFNNLVVSAWNLRLIDAFWIMQSSKSNLLWFISVDGGLLYCGQNEIFLVSISQLPKYSYEKRFWGF
jgi:hypothetical protein